MHMHYFFSLITTSSSEALFIMHGDQIQGWINKCGGPVQKKICGANPQDQNEMTVVFNCCN